MKKIFYGMILLPMFIASIPALSNPLTYGPTIANERLYRIAMRVRANPNLSIQQVMIALLEKNPRAFSKRNINYLKSGYRLVIPATVEIAQINQNLALKQVELQNKIWFNKGNLPLNTSDVAIKKNNKNSVIQDFVQASYRREPSDFIDINKHPFGAAVETSMTSFSSANVESPVGYLAPFQQHSNQFEQQTNNQIENLQNKTKSLEQKVNKLSEELRGVTYQFVQLSAMVKSERTNSYSNNIMNNLKKYGLSLSGSFLILALLLVWYRKAFSVKSNDKASNTQDEYNFLEGEDSIPTKLDLARAYIDMGDDHAAQATLRDVLKKGDENQRQTAHDLMSKLNLTL